MDLQVFVVCEGDVYSVESAPVWLNQNNWLCEWIFVGARSPDEALAVAAVVDEKGNKRIGRVYTKVLSLRDIRSRILDLEDMTPSQIYKTQGNRVNSKRLQFNQGWV